MFQFQRLAASAALSGALLLCGCSFKGTTAATAPASSRPAATQLSVAPLENMPNSSAQSLPAPAPQAQQAPDANFNANVEGEVSPSNSAAPMDSATGADVRQNQREDATNRQEEFARNREMQKQQARQGAERQDAAQRAIWDRVDRNEAQRRDSEAAAVRQLDENRRNREMEASQRSIERQESEKRDIARLGSGDAFDGFRMETRDNRIENERRRMRENQ